MESERYHNKEGSVDIRENGGNDQEDSVKFHIKSEPEDDCIEDVMMPEFIEIKREEAAGNDAERHELREEPFCNISPEEQIIMKSETGDSFPQDEDTSEAEAMEDPLFVAIKEEPNIETSSDESCIDEDFNSSYPPKGSFEKRSRYPGEKDNNMKTQEIIDTRSEEHIGKQMIEEEPLNNSSSCANLCVSLSSFASSADFEVFKSEESEGRKIPTQLKSECQEILKGKCNVQEGNKQSCKIQCAKIFSRSGSRIPRVQKDNDVKTYKCNECDKVFSKRNILTVHMRIHTGEKPYKCSECNNAFSVSSHLAAHMRTHTGEKPYKCSHCNKGFSRSGNLTAHMRIHTGEKPFKCNLCNKAFCVSNNLTAHMRFHTGEKPYKCSECNSAFSISGHLASHMRIHTGERPYICSQCNKGFAQSSSLTAHMRIHNGDKPYKCSQCDKAFSNSGTFTAHMRIHTGEKPHKCSHCSKVFSQSGSLTNHMRIHTGTKPYKCNQCDKAFTRSSTLAAHLRIHTGER